MKTFEYKGLKGAGQSCRGLVEALSVKEAREKLAAEGILAERIGVTGRAARLRADARASLYRELAALLAAGIPMVRAMDMLIQASRNRTVGVALAGVRDRIREGSALADALAEGGRAPGGFEYAIIHAGERAGTQASVLERLASFIEDQERLRERVQRALIYPAVVVGVGLCVAVVMLGVLVPRAGAMLADSGRPLPALTRVMMAAGHFTVQAAIPLAVVTTAVVVLSRRRLRRELSAREAWDGRLFSIPLWGRSYAHLACLRFARTLALLMKGGVPLVEGVALAGEATGSPWVARALRVQAEAVRHGARLSDCLRQVPPLADLLPGWVQIGEESGDLAGMLEHAGTRFAEQWDRDVSRALALLEPLLLLAIGLFVLLVTLAVLLPILSLTQTVSIR